MKEILISNNIPLSGSETRLELWGITKNFKEKLPFSTDDMAKKYNMQVLRTPPYHFEFNLIELVWKDVKHYLEKNNTEFKTAHISNLIREFQ